MKITIHRGIDQIGSCITEMKEKIKITSDFSL